MHYALVSMVEAVDQARMLASRETRADADGRPPVLIFRSPLFNPSETFVQAQAASLSRYQPWIVGLRDKGHAMAQLEDRIILASRSEGLALSIFGRADRLAARLAGLRPALVHAHFGTDGVTALPLARALGRPLVTTLHGYDVARAPNRLLLSGRISWMRYGLFQRRLAREGDLFLAVSDAVRDRAVARGFPAERTITHLVGIDLARFRPGPGPEAGLILHVGRLVEKKGTSKLLAAFSQVHTRCPEARLVIIGDGPLRPRLEKLASETGAGPAISFLGRLPSEAVAEWMRRAWLVAAPSVTAQDGDAEGLPTVVVEAAASGVPAVSTRHAGIPEAIVDGETGFIVGENDVDALRHRIEELLADPDRRAAMGASARRFAEGSFDLQRQTALLEAHYDRVRRAA